MKDLNELEFKYSELKETISTLLNNDFKVYTFEKIGRYTEQIFYTDQKNEGVSSVSADLGGVKRSTVHESKNGSGFGTGFGIDSDPMINLQIEDLKEGFAIAPDWVKGADRTKANESITKYKDWKDYLNNNTILTYFEIKA